MVALKEISPTVPIVFVAVTDPVGAGIVASLARPRGNATGFTLFEYGIAAKWLELLKEIAPGVARVLVLREATNPSGIGQFAAIQTVTPTGIELSVANLQEVGEIERAIAEFSLTWDQMGTNPHRDFGRLAKPEAESFDSEQFRLGPGT